jgi:oligopeptide transport system substrate-binding protein
MPVANLINRRLHRIGTTLGIAGVCFLASCTELRRPEPNPYLAETQPPMIQEFRWSNGGLPNSFDPAKASNAPETDLARALYEGLTVIDAKTLEARPGVAEEWVASDEGLTWTFTLRADAKWTNGRAVEAGDFVRSWQRLYDLGGKAAHRNLLQNFAITSGKAGRVVPESEPEDFMEPTSTDGEETVPQAEDARTAEPTPSSKKEPEKILLAVSAADARTLVVKLQRPDKDFPKLVAHPVFMPVFGNGSGFESQKLSTKIIGNGAFRMAELAASGIALERSKTYWNSESVKIEKLQFVPLTKSDEALEAYRTGKIDVLTNAEISPLAQKVFSTAADFRKNTFAALNFYEINFRKAPFNDRRVREALAVSIERERLAGTENESATTPALSFLPFAFGTQKRLVQDKDRARDLLEQAGFPGGRGFPAVKLTVNRNETQLRVARAVAKMWKDNLNIETELVVKENAEIATIRETQDFDVIRRGVVLPVPDEMICMAAINGTDPFPVSNEELDRRFGSPPNANANISNSNIGTQPQAAVNVSVPLLTEAEALYQLHSIPLYFPTSFALVKPYVTGFEMNTLDSPNLTETEIDTAWQPPAR